MADPNGMLEEFRKYLDAVQSEGRKPSGEDIDYFIDEFLKSGRNGFLFNRLYFYSAERKDPVTGEPLYDKSKKSYSELVNEIKPILEARVIEAHGSVSERYAPYKWDTKPMTVDQYADYYAGDLDKKGYEKLSGTDRRNHPAYRKAVEEIQRIKYRIKEYMRITLPFTARLTMYHRLAAVLYDTSKGPFQTIQRNDDSGNPFTIDSEEKLNRFVENKTVDGFPGVDHDGIRSLFWVPTESGRNIKIGIIDIDNPAGLTDREMLKYVKKIYRRMAFDLEHPAIIMFTGESFQIWIGQSRNEAVLTVRELNDYLKTTLSDIASFKKDEAIELKLPHIDTSANVANKPIRTFFSLHYPPTTTASKPYSGLAAVPVPFTHLDKFNRVIDAHPEAVLANFDTYSSMVASFYDQVQIGQDYGSADDIETQPSCSRLEQKYPDAAILKAVYKESELNVIQYKNAAAALEDEEKVYAHPVARGVLAVLVYDPKGDTRPDGMTTKRVVRGKVTTKAPSSYYILSNGTVIYDDYICRDFERACQAKKLKQAVLVGRVSLIDTFGNEQGEQDTMNELIRPEGILQSQARIMRFTINRAPVVNSARVPIEIMGEQIKQFAAKRIVPSPYFEFEKPVGAKIKSKYMDLVRSKMSGTMMVEGEEKYLIKSTRTLYATIVGVDISGKAFASETDMPPVLIAVGNKSSKHGAEYITLAKAQIALKKEDRMTLRSLVEGIDKKNLIPAPRGEYADKVKFAEPAVVVEVSYDDVTPQTFLSFAFAFNSTGDFRAIKTKRAINRLVNAKVIAIREDLDHRIPKQISYRQEELLELSSSPSRSDFNLVSIPNPPSKLPEFIRRNPGSFFGVPQTLDVYLGGSLESRVDTLPDGSKVVREYASGGRRVQLPLLEPAKGRYLGEKIPGELEKAWERYDKGEPGYKVFVDKRSLVKGEIPHYRTTNLGQEYNLAIDDRYGMGQDANSVTSMNKQIEKPSKYLDVMETIHLEGNERQKIEDSKVYSSTFRSIPGNIDSEDPMRGNFDRGYVESYKAADNMLKAALRPTILQGEEQNAAVDAIMSNPRPIKDDLWKMRLGIYIEEFNKWFALPEPKEEWEKYAMGMFLPWEVPLLEKDRLMAEASSKYELSQEEASQIDMQYVNTQSEDMFDLILSDLYEVPEDDADFEEATL